MVFEGLKLIAPKKELMAQITTLIQALTGLQEVVDIHIQYATVFRINTAVSGIQNHINIFGQVAEIIQ